MLAPEMLTDKAARSLQGLVPCAMGLCESYCSSLSEDTDTMCLSPSNAVPSHWQSVTPFGQAATAGWFENPPPASLWDLSHRLTTIYFN